MSGASETGGSGDSEDFAQCIYTSLRSVSFCTGKSECVLPRSTQDIILVFEGKLPHQTRCDKVRAYPDRCCPIGRLAQLCRDDILKTLRSVDYCCHSRKHS